MLHELKILPEHFNDIKDGVKTFEIRKNDRDFMEKDVLALNEWTGKEYTGRFILAKVDKIYRYPEYLKDGYIIMGLGGFDGYALEQVFYNGNRTKKGGGQR